MLQQTSKVWNQKQNLSSPQFKLICLYTKSIQMKGEREQEKF